MKGRTIEGSIELDSLLKEENGIDNWLGYNVKHGWLLLDRSIDGNEPGIGGNSTLRFIRLSDWRIVAVPRENWHNGSITTRAAASTPEEKEKLQSLLLEWRRRRSHWAVQRRWKEIPKILIQRATAVAVTPPVATYEDLKLCLTWSNVDPGSDSGFAPLLRKLKKEIGSYHASRLISARLAERCAAFFYEGLGYVVRDTSIEQLKDPIQGDWRDFDLDIGYLVDVKNSRATLNGKQHYSEHAVPEFKQHRMSGQNVRVVGVRSPYISDPEETARGEGGADVMVLGEVSASDINRLVNWMEARFGHLLSLRMWTPKKIPGWLFEYPDHYYVGRARAVDLMQALTFEGQPKRVMPGQWLVAKALGINLEAPFESDPLLTELGDLIETCGLAKRCLIIYTMGAILRAVADGKDFVSIITKLKNAAHIGTSSHPGSYPWGLEDPLNYVDRFMSAFFVLAQSIKPYIPSTRIFRLEGPEVLVAEMNDGSNWTMLAYCGGWIEGKGRCGSFPLVVGRQKHCSKCRHLICSDCFFCSVDCEPERIIRSQSAGANARNPWCAYTETSDDLDERGHGSRSTGWDLDHSGAAWEAGSENRDSWDSNVKDARTG